MFGVLACVRCPNANISLRSRRCRVTLKRIGVSVGRSLSYAIPGTPTTSTGDTFTVRTVLSECRPRCRCFYTVVPAPVAAKTFVNIGRVYRVSPSCIVFPVNSLSTFDFITAPPWANRCCAMIRIRIGSRWKRNTERSVNNSVDDGYPPWTQTFTPFGDRTSVVFVLPPHPRRTRRNPAEQRPDV